MVGTKEIWEIKQYSAWDKKEPLLDIWDKPIFEGQRIKTLEKDKKEYSQIGRRESAIGVDEEQDGCQCWVPNTTREGKNRNECYGYKKEGLFVILEKSKFNGVGKVEVWSQSSSEDEKRECGDNETFFSSGHLTVKEKKVSGSGWSLFKKKQKQTAYGIIWPPGCKRICRPGKVFKLHNLQSSFHLSVYYSMILYLIISKVQLLFSQGDTCTQIIKSVLS